MKVLENPTIIIIDRKAEAEGAEGGLWFLDQKFSACFVMDWDNNVGIIVEGTVRYSERLKSPNPEIAQRIRSKPNSIQFKKRQNSPPVTRSGDNCIHLHTDPYSKKRYRQEMKLKTKNTMWVSLFVKADYFFLQTAGLKFPGRTPWILLFFLLVFA